jgi:predicted nucleotidyltransferase/HEPN domain-containing protein
MCLEKRFGCKAVRALECSTIEERLGREYNRILGLGRFAIRSDPVLVKGSLDHLPEGKRRELEFVVQVIREGFDFAVARRTMPRLRNARLLKIILFGSYARGDWVEDPVGRYFSDFDLLVVVNSDELTDVSEFWEKTEDRLLEELSAGRNLRTPVSVIYHSLDDVNEKLRLGRYFFLDIVNEGILLFEEPGHPFAEPQALSAKQALRETDEYFQEWFESAGKAKKGAEFYLTEGDYKDAAFLFHQAVERLYHCVLLVLTLHSPKSHNLSRLRQLAEGLEPRLKAIWPRETKFQRRCFELLREAYVKARYSREYRISRQELEWLASRIELLQELVREACLERIQEPAKAA